MRRFGIVLLIIACAALPFTCGGCGLFAEKPTKEAYKFGGEAIAWIAMGAQPQLMIPGVFKVVSSSLWPEGLKGSTPATAQETADADALLIQVTQAQLDAKKATVKKLAELRKQLADLEAAAKAEGQKP